MLMCALLIAVPVTTESASAAVATNRTAKAKISGWVTVQNGEKKYYKKGQYLKGCKKIEKNYYYFGPKGVMKTQDITSHGVTYFIERNGHVLGCEKVPDIWLLTEESSIKNRQQSYGHIKMRVKL